MTKTKSPATAARVTACPECDSGNLHFEGSSVECLSCGWTHKATKPQRTSKAKPKGEAEKGITKGELLASPIVQDALNTLNMSPEDFNKCMDRAAEQGSIAAQLTAAVQAAPAPKAKSERKPRATAYTITAKGIGFSPDPERARVTKDKNRNTWLAVKALFADPEATVALAQIWEVAPAHKDFVGYAVRSGWLAVAK